MEKKQIIKTQRTIDANLMSIESKTLQMRRWTNSVEFHPEAFVIELNEIIKICEKIKTIIKP